MTTESLGALVARVVADTEGFRTEMRRLQKEVSTNTAKMNQSLARIDQGTQRWGKSIALLRSQFGFLIGGTGIAIMARQIARAGIEMEGLERRFRAATGSVATAAVEFAFVREEANRLGLDFQTAAKNFSGLAAAAKGTSLEGTQTRDIFIAIAEASRVLNLSNEDTEGSFRAIEQIISKGRVSAEELRQQLGERLPGAFQIAARSINVTTARLDEMLRRGELTANELLPSMARELRKTFGPEVESATNDAQSAFNRLSTSIFELKVAIAESGVLDLMREMADLSSKILTGIGAAFLGRVSPVPFENEIQQARRLVESLRPSVEATLPAIPVELYQQWTAANAELRKYIALQNQALGLGVEGASSRNGNKDGSKGGKGIGKFDGLLPFAVPAEQITQNLTNIRELVQKSEEEFTAFLEGEYSKRTNLAARAAADELAIVQQSQLAQLDFRSAVAQNIVGIVRGIFGEQKAVQLAAIAFEQLASVRRLAILSEEAAQLAFASQLVPGDPSSYYRAAVARAKVRASFARSKAKVVTTAVLGGLAQAAQTIGSNGQLGSYTNPVAVTSAGLFGGSTGAGPVAESRDQRVTQVYLTGDFYGWDKYMERRFIDALSRAVNNDEVVIIDRNSRQAREILQRSGG